MYKKVSKKDLGQKARIVVKPRFRILHKGDIAIGPGKADLLRAIHETGSISQAAKQLEMSYMRAWKLIETLQECKSFSKGQFK